ncbi:MAG: hypothetical protein LBU66_00540 [Treponema sp.]|jgi:hypothetical protein|nr:hypothetical protein [Treponema sp.]
MLRNTLKPKAIIVFLAVTFFIFAACDEETAGGYANGDNKPVNGEGDNTEYITPVAGIEIGTLCTYHYMGGPSGAHVFQSNDQLTAFLDSTGYDESREWGITLKMTHQPNFERWTYFAYAGGLDWRSRRRKVDITESDDTIMVNYIRLLPPRRIDDMCPSFDPPLPIVNVYFIPFTEKTIKWTETVEYLECCGRH